MYPRTILSGMLTNVRPTAGGTVKQAFLHGRGGPRLMMRYGQAPQREISSLSWEPPASAARICIFAI